MDALLWRCLKHAPCSQAQSPALQPLFNAAMAVAPPTPPHPTPCRCEDWGTEYDGMPTPHDHELVAPFCDPEYHPVTPDGEPYQVCEGGFGGWGEPASPMRCLNRCSTRLPRPMVLA